MTDKIEWQSDLYELLQVHPKADLAIIKKAYQTLMMQAHPDVGGDEEVARRLNYAYEILSDSEKRQQYDIRRQQFLALRQKKRAEAAKIASAPAKQAPPPGNCPIWSDRGIILADERGHRVILINTQGESLWQYGGSEAAGDQRLALPRHASFSSSDRVLIADSGNHRVIEIDFQKKTTWQFATGLKDPHYARRLPNGHTLIADTGNDRVIEVSPKGDIVWEYADGLSAPRSAERLKNGNTLISDTSNFRLIEVMPTGKLAWQYPRKAGLFDFFKAKQEPLEGANFAWRQDDGSTLVASHELISLTPDEQIIRQETGLADADIHHSYVLDDGSILINYTHVVKRGVNQEVALFDRECRALWRHYYSQQRVI